jgi:AcrR family transcriptional regulator
MSGAVGMPPAVAELWGRSTASRRGPKPRFSLDDVAAAAVRVADREGLTGLSLAGIAAELGLTTTALYRYVDSKDTLVEVAINHAMAPGVRITARSWRGAVRQWTTAYWGLHRRHPWLSEVRPSGLPRTPNPLLWMEQLLAVLQPVVPAHDPMSSVLLIEGLVRSYAGIRRPPGGGTGETAAAVLAQLQGRPEAFPHLLQLAQRDYADLERELHVALEVVLDGLAASSSDG